MSPQGIGGDDRCGVYALSKIYGQSSRKPWLLFTCDEEVGGIGAHVFCEDHAKGKLPESLSNLKFLIELDRKGSVRRAKLNYMRERTGKAARIKANEK